MRSSTFIIQLNTKIYFVDLKNKYFITLQSRFNAAGFSASVSGILGRGAWRERERGIVAD